MRFACLQKVNPLWNVSRGCGHSFHIECILTNISDCPVCQTTTLANVEALGRSCLLERQQILTLFAPATRFEEDKSDEESEAADDD